MLRAFAAAFALAATPALADLTAEEVLADQLSLMDLFGLEVEIEGTSRSGDVLTVETLSSLIHFPEDDFAVLMSVQGISLTEQDDGSVVVTLPEETTMTLAADDEGEDFSLDLALKQDGVKLTASGTPGQILYELTGISILLEGEHQDSDEDLFVDVNARLDMVDMLATMTVGMGTVRPYNFEAAAEMFQLAFDGYLNSFSLDGGYRFNDVRATYSGKLAKRSAKDSYVQGIAKGNAKTGSITHGESTYGIGTNAGTYGFDLDLGISTAGGSYFIAEDTSGARYNGTYKDVKATAEFGRNIGFPKMEFSLAEASAQLQIPLVPGDDPQDIALSATLTDLEIDPALWSMFDPEKLLPRVPASLVVDASGEVILTEDISTPEFAEKSVTELPGQINNLKIDEFLLSLAGTELTGDGDLTFDNQSGFPMPIGVANLALTGGETLIDTLVTLGLVPEQQAAFARMMTGMMGRTGDDPDTLVSAIEMKEDGSILANGQRIR